MFKISQRIMNKFCTMSLFTLMIFSRIAYADTSSQIIDLPFVLLGNSPIVKAYIKDQPNPVNLLLDTGATDLVLIFPENTVQQYGIRKLEESRTIYNSFTRQPIVIRKLEVPTFRLGSLVQTNLDNVYEDPKVWGFCDHKDCVHDGIIGLAFFKQAHYNLSIDYKNLQVQLVPYGDLSNSYRGNYFVQSTRKDGMVSVQQFGSTPVTFYWDTGASNAYAFNDNLLSSEYKKVIANTTFVSLPVNFGSLVVPLDIVIDPRRLNKVGCEGVCSFIGYDFFINHKVFFDLENDRLYINS